MRATLRDAPVVVMPRGTRPFVQPSVLFAFVKRYPAQRQRDVFPRAAVAAPRAVRRKDRRARMGTKTPPGRQAARRRPAPGPSTPKTATPFSAPRRNPQKTKPPPAPPNPTPPTKKAPAT